MDGKWGCIDTSGRWVIPPESSRQGLLQKFYSKSGVIVYNNSYYHISGKKLTYPLPLKPTKNTPVPLSTLKNRATFY